MKTSIYIASFAALALVGAGCPTPQAPGAKTPTTQGFGKLPTLAASAPTPLGSAAAMSSFSAKGFAPSKVVVPSTAAADGTAVSVEAGVAVAEPSRVQPPYPYPGPKPGVVEYSIDADLPSWGQSGDVLKVKRPLPDPKTVSALAQSAGVPPQAMSPASTISSMSVQWRDPDKFAWTFDAGNRSLSFWEEVPYPQKELTDSGNPDAKFDEAEILKIADAFMDSRGFGALRQGGGVIQDLPYLIQGGTTGQDVRAMPCAVLNAVSEQGSAPSGGASAGEVSGGGVAVKSDQAEPSRPDISPCWWPMQATVMYGGTREGRKVVDAGGSPFRHATISVDLRTKEVTNGWIQLDENVDRSSYPLIGRDAAQKRLQSGGQNPVWPYGEGGVIRVKLSSVEIVWLRYDSWQEGVNETYYLPALLATGTVGRGIKGQPPEEYRTLVPLVEDAAFVDQNPVPPPVPLPLESGGGSAPGAPGVEIQTAPAVKSAQ